MSGVPGWYNDPSNDDLQWYWDGSRYTQSRSKGKATPISHADSANRIPTWMTSWPVIIVGFFLCLLPGFVLPWLRPQSSRKTKGIVSGVVAVLAIAAAVSPQQPKPAASSAAPQPVASVPTIATPTDTPSLTETASATPTAALTPTPTPTAIAPPAAGTAAAMVAALPVKGRAPKTGYSRDQFGTGWVDINRNGCDTRNDILKLYLTAKVMSGSCKVLAGTLADPYTATSIRFVYGGASEVDIDHMVALSDAWQKGAARWPFAKRVAFANDPLNLQPTEAGANRAKGDGDAATWLPPNKSYRCTYVARQAAVKHKYGVWVTAPEKAAMLSILSSCPTMTAPAPGPQPTIASNTGGAAPGSSTPAPAPTKTSGGGGLDPRFATCKAAKAAGYGPYYKDKDPEYYWYRDADHDGVDCE